MTWLLQIPEHQREMLAVVRHWENLKGASDGAFFWVKDLTDGQVTAVEILSLPGGRVFRAEDGKLFSRNSLLPAGNEPALLWTPIARALPVTLPDLNFNYFGGEKAVAFRLVETGAEQPPVALLASLDALAQYVETAPAVRLQPLQWLLAGPDQALVLGQPLLPVPGQVCWQCGYSLLPAGYAFEFPGLEKALHTRLSPEGEHLILWFTDGQYALLPRPLLQPLSIASFRKSILEKTLTP